MNGNYQWNRHMSRERSQGRYQEAAQHRLLKQQKMVTHSYWQTFNLPATVKAVAGKIRQQGWAPLSQRMQHRWQWLLLFGLIFLVACSGAASGNSPAEPTALPPSKPETEAVDSQPASAEPAAYTITYGPEGASVPDGIPAGLVSLAVENQDTE